MAQQTVIHLIDDVDETPAAESIRFELDRVAYEIDLSQANATLFREQLAPWVSAARQTSARRRPRK